MIERVSFDRTRVRVSTETSVLPYAEGVRILESVREVTAAILPEGWETVVSGNLAIDTDWVTDVQETQLRSIPIAFGIVFILVSLFLRSPLLGFAALIPTFLPVALTLGMMGWLGLSLDIGRAMIAAVSGVYVAAALKSYLVDLADASRRHPGVEIGLSPRATLQLSAAARGHAAARGRNYATPDDVKTVGVAALSHRVVVRSDRGSNLSPTDAVLEVFDSVPVPVAR